MILKCPYCKGKYDDCDCPDLIYKDITNDKDIDNQVELLYSINECGYNIVTCPNCGSTFIHKTEE